MKKSGRQPVVIHPSGRRELHAAQWIVVHPERVIENGCLEIEDGRILAVHTARPNEKVVDHGSGVLMPPLVNTHLHLELSALKGLLPFDLGFKAWVKALLEKRESLGEAALIEKAREALEELAASGTLILGDISTLNITGGELLKDAALGGVFFHELLGDSEERFQTQRGRYLSFSLAGHAPHSTSPNLLCALKRTTMNAGLPFSIHVAESHDEIEFLRDKKGEWADFLSARGINWADWPVGGKTPVEYIDDMGLLDDATLVVHALRAGLPDIKILAESGAKVCVCPRSNLNLHGKLPDISAMVSHGIAPALGTDSLASCDSLDIFDEMAFVCENYPALDPFAIFSMGTLNGAKALGMEKIAGDLTPGKSARMVYLPIRAGDKKAVFREIVSNA